MGLFNKDKGFSKRTKKELYSVFDHLPKSIVDMVYDVFFFSMVLVLRFSGSPEFNKMMDAFNEFLAKCADIEMESSKQDEKSLEDIPEANVEYWLK